MPGSMEKAWPGSSRVPLPATMYGSSCSSMPMPWPVRWMNCSPQPGVGDDRAGGGVDGLAGGADHGGGDGGLLCVEQHGVGLGQLLGRLAEVDAAGDVGAVADPVVAEHRAAEVAEHHLALLDDPVARLVVGAGRVGAGGHDGEVHPLVALGEEAPAQLGRHLRLGAPHQRRCRRPAARPPPGRPPRRRPRRAAISASSLRARSGPMTSPPRVNRAPGSASLEVDEEPGPGAVTDRQAASRRRPAPPRWPRDRRSRPMAGARTPRDDRPPAAPPDGAPPGWRRPRCGSTSMVSRSSGMAS